MDTLACISSRRSIRKYKDVPVEMSKIGSIVDAGRYAPSAGNLQSWKFIIVTADDVKHQIADACLQQYWMEKAPVHLVVCAETVQLKQYYDERGEKNYAYQNAAAATQNILLACHALNLGSCWISAFEEEKLHRVLDIPENVIPTAVITIGYPDEQPIEPARYTIEVMTFLNSYGARIADMQWVLGHYSFHVEKAMKQGKQLINKMSKLLQK